MEHFAFAKLNPRPALLYLFGLLVVTALSRNPVFLLTALGAAFAMNFYYDRMRTLKPNLPFYCLLCGLFFLLNPIFSHRGATVLFYVFSRPITLESFVYGGVSAVSLFTVLVVFSFYQVVFTSERIFYIFGTVLPRTTLIMMLALRFLPFLKRRWQDIHCALASRGLNLSTGAKRGRQTLLVLQVLLASGLEEAITTAQSMRARGYDLPLKRSFYHRYRMQKKDWGFLFLILLLLAGVFYAVCRGAGDWPIYPRLQKPPFQSLGIVAELLFLFYVSIPFGMEGLAGLKWRFWK